MRLSSPAQLCWPATATPELQARKLADGLPNKCALTDSVRRYGEIVDMNLVRDKATGKSKGFAFIAYEDQRSTVGPA